MTRRLRGIHAAWHFWYAVSFGSENALRKVGSATRCSTLLWARDAAKRLNGIISPER
nr:DUF3265 domain-containing protein [Vibrio navarrensis]